MPVRIGSQRRQAIETLCNALREMWGPDQARSRTLARLAQHERQIEDWWKCEMATWLWDYAHRFGDDAYIWLESIDRADVAIATGTRTDGKLALSGEGGLCIPIELKTVGTFWGTNVNKAYGDPSKKTLKKDIADARSLRRVANPFAAVALLVTHVGKQTDQILNLYLKGARTLGNDGGLKLVLDEPVPLPLLTDETPAAAHQLVWATPGQS